MSEFPNHNVKSLKMSTNHKRAHQALSRKKPKYDFFIHLLGLLSALYRPDGFHYHNLQHHRHRKAIVIIWCTINIYNNSCALCMHAQSYPGAQEQKSCENKLKNSTKVYQLACNANSTCRQVEILITCGAFDLRLWQFYLVSQLCESICQKPLQFLVLKMSTHTFICKCGALGSHQIAAD